MALNRSNKYPGRFLAPTAARPQGAFKNRTSPTAQDGSYLEADWANDWDGFFARILTVANVTPNGNVDSGTASQLYDALLSAMPGRLLNVQRLLATGTYTPTPGTKRLIVEMIGGGAASGGVPASSSTSNFASGGGGAGAYIRFLLDNPPETVPVTVGAAGQPGGGTGLPGGLSQFGNYALVNGGQGASFGQAANDKLLVNGGMGGSVGATSGVVVINAQNGQKGGTAVMLSGGNGSLNDGANSPLGTGGAGSGNGAGLTGSGFGSGGGGSMTVVQATGVGYSGAPGRPGIIIIWEYT